MGSEENYLDTLLKSVTEPKETESEETMSLAEETEEAAATAGESVTDEPVTDELKTTVVIETLDIVEASDEAGDIDVPEIPDIEPAEKELSLADIGELEASDAEATEETEAAEFQIDDLEKVSESAVSDELSIDDIDAALSDELNIADIDLSASEDELSIDDIGADIADALNIAESEATEELMPEENASEPAEDTGSEELDLSALEESVLEDAETEMPETEEAVLEPVEDTQPEMSEEMNLEDAETEIEEELKLEDAEPESELEPSEELRLGELDLEGLGDDGPEIPDLEEETADKLGVDGELEDVLSMLDDDADLAEINDILKKSDNKEPIQDEMMDLLNQMADDEAELVNAGVKDIVDDDGVPLPQMPIAKKKTGEAEEEDNKENKKKKKENENKEPGAVGKFLNMLTEDLPGPTEEEYAAEDAAKAAKKQEAKDKKEQEKLAKDEEKKAKAEEKAAAKKAKADAAAQKKKEKDAAKAAKAEAKKAKQQAEAAKRAKRIPPKKIAAVAVFGASVLGAVVVSTTILSNQGYINVAKKAFYDGDYKSVYLATYGMELNDSDALIQAKSEVILKMQRWYDSYQNNLKLNRQREALDALIRGVESYDHINAEAEQYGVLSEVDGIKNTILNVLETEYGLSEAQVRELLQYDDALAYTIALNDIITGE